MLLNQNLFHLIEKQCNLIVILNVFKYVVFLPTRLQMPFSRRIIVGEIMSYTFLTFIHVFVLYQNSFRIW